MRENEQFVCLVESLHHKALECSDLKNFFKKSTPNASEFVEMIVKLASDEDAYNLQSDLGESSWKMSELAILALISHDEVIQDTATKTVLEVVNKLLIVSADKLAGEFLESFVAGMDFITTDAAQILINFTAHLAGVSTGTTLPPKVSPLKNPAMKGRLASLLNVGLYQEVVGFLREKRKRNQIDSHRELVKGISKPVISVCSRKGGSGKSTLLLGILNWFCGKHPGARVCILDLDLSGPTWKYLLFPEFSYPRTFLNDFFNENYDDGSFFPQTESSFYHLLENIDEIPCETIEGKPTIGLLGVRDLPRSLRDLRKILDLKIDEFYPFFIKLVRCLANMYDLILIDNSPGFDDIPNCSLSVASNVDHGLAFIMSTPSHADIAGTFIELSDLRLLGQDRSPIWVVNRLPNGYPFFTRKWNAYYIARRLKAYDGVLPSRPILEKLELPVDTSNIWHQLPFDPFVSEIGYVKDDTPTILPGSELSKTNYGRALEKMMDEFVQKDKLSGISCKE